MKVGPDKGLVVPDEIARLLESKSMLKTYKVDLSKPDFDSDVLIVGAGGAGPRRRSWPPRRA